MHRFSSMKNSFLLVLLPAIIANLSADTNPTPEIDTSTSSVTSQAPSPDTAQFSLVQMCQANAQELEMLLNVIVPLKGGNDAEQMAMLLEPAMVLCASIKELPQDADQQTILQNLHWLNQSATYLDKALNTNPGELGDLILDGKAPLSSDSISSLQEQFEVTINRVIKQVSESYQDIQANLAMNVQKQLNTLDKILETLNANISNSKLVDKAEIKKEIYNLRTELQLVRREFSTIGASNPQAALIVLQINKAIVEYLKECIKYKFRKWDRFNLADVLKRIPEIEPDLDTLLYEMSQTNIQLESLALDAEKIDLSIINKLARGFNEYVVTPIQKYDLLKRAAIVGLSGAALTYIAYYFDDYFFKDPNCAFRKALGFHNKSLGRSAPPTLMSQQILKNSLNENLGRTVRNELKSKIILDVEKAQEATKPVGWVGHTDEYLYDITHNVSTINTLILGGLAYLTYREWTELQPKIVRKISLWFKRLQGGSYAKQAEKFDEVFPVTNFDDVIGMDYEKSLVYPHIKYIKDPERWDTNGFTPTTGILLTGPTRAGKTFFAKALCGEIHRQSPDRKLRFFTIDAHDIKEKPIAYWMWVAKMEAPCVLFIDEIDLLNLQRTGDRTLLADFLQMMSGIGENDPKKQVIIIGTTNKPENIDHALLQPGRFALEIRFKYPTFSERKLFISKRLEQFAIDPTAFELDIDKLARLLDGKTFEDIKLVIDTAFIHIGIRGEVISQEQLEWAVDRQMNKIIDIDSKQIAPEERRMVSAHYAGQALAHILLGLDEKISKVTTNQVNVKVKEESIWVQFETVTQKQTGIEQGAIFTYLPNDSLNIKTQSQDQIAKKAKTFLASRIAERMLTGSTSMFYGSKKNTAFNMIKSIIADGIDPKSLSKAAVNQLNDEAMAKMKVFEQEMEALLNGHSTELAALTKALEEKRTLDFNQIMTIIGKNKEEDKALSTVDPLIQPAAA